jgi:hypothetical protein
VRRCLKLGHSPPSAGQALLRASGVSSTGTTHRPGCISYVRSRTRGPIRASRAERGTDLVSLLARAASLPAGCGQGRGRTADLPIFRAKVVHSSKVAHVSELQRRGRVAAPAHPRTLADETTIETTPRPGSWARLIPYCDLGRSKRRPRPHSTGATYEGMTRVGMSLRRAR